MLVVFVNVVVVVMVMVVVVVVVVSIVVGMEVVKPNLCRKASILLVAPVSHKVVSVGVDVYVCWNW